MVVVSRCPGGGHTSSSSPGHSSSSSQTQRPERSCSAMARTLPVAAPQHGKGVSLDAVGATGLQQHLLRLSAGRLRGTHRVIIEASPLAIVSTAIVCLLSGGSEGPGAPRWVVRRRPAAPGVRRPSRGARRGGKTAGRPSQRSPDPTSPSRQAAREVLNPHQPRWAQPILVRARRRCSVGLERRPGVESQVRHEDEIPWRSVGGCGAHTRSPNFRCRRPSRASEIPFPVSSSPSSSPFVR